jgi:hypothetical protein
MPAAVDFMVMLLPTVIDPAKVCLSCQDNERCKGCVFSKQTDQEELTVLEAVI